METSPLEATVRPFAPTGYLYGPDGTLLVHHPEPPIETREPPRLPGDPNEPPELVTTVIDGIRHRELLVTVRHPEAPTVDADHREGDAGPLTHPRRSP